MIFWVVTLCGGIGGYQHFEGTFVPWRSRQYFFRNDGWPHRVTTHKTTINIPYSSPWDPLHLSFLGNVKWENSPSMWLISCEDVIEFSRRESKMSCIDSILFYSLFQWSSLYNMSCVSKYCTSKLYFAFRNVLFWKNVYSSVTEFRLAQIQRLKIYMLNLKKNPQFNIGFSPIWILYCIQYI